MTSDLQQHLNDCMAETQLMIGLVTPAVQVLTQALHDDPNLTVEAQVLIETGTPLEQRDHVTRWQNSLLRQALGPVHGRNDPG